MFIMFNPVVALIYNLKLDRWHPAVYVEADLPGPAHSDKPTRHRSKGHHTEGFKKREDALAEMVSIVKKIKDAKLSDTGSAAMDAANDLQWDGESIPADVAFFKIVGETATRLL